MAGLRVLRRWQAGIETTRGTDVAATRKFGALGTIEKRQPGYIPDLDINSFDRMRDRFALLIEAGGTIEFPATYEDLPWWFQLALKGGVAGVQIGATTAYRYTHTPTASTDDLKSVTFEWGDDFQAWEATFGMVDTFTVRGDPRGALMCSATILAKDRATTTFTGALTDRAVEAILGKTATLYIDEPGGTIGTTTVAGRLLGFEFSIRNRLARLYAMDNADAGKINDITREGREFETRFLYRFNNRDEYDKWAANTQRLIKVKFVGTDAGSGNLREWSLYAPGKYEDAVLGDQDGQVTVQMTMKHLYDTTLAYAVKTEVVNALSSLP